MAANFCPSTSSLRSRSVRTVYLLTYSKANSDICSTREAFAGKVLEAFRSAGAEVVQWVCYQEEHKDNAGYPYHMAVKLLKQRRWSKVKTYLQKEFNIVAHFSSNHANYYTAWAYVTKEDGNFLQSEGHPDLEDAETPQSTKATSSRIEKSSKVAGKGRKRRQRLTAFEVSEIVISRNIKSRTELLALANQQKRQGKTDLAEFIVNRGKKWVTDTIQVAWEMHNAEEKLQRERMTRTEILRSFLSKDCSRGCGGNWLLFARDILQRNDICLETFTSAVSEALEKGRGKYRNILITGPANCGKTFILSPLTEVFDSFCNPASTSFAWVGADKAEIIFLNDFRWKQEIIPWHDMLLLLEGQLVHLPAPKTHFSQDMVLTGTTPVFCTSKHELIYIKGGQIDEKETEMMAVRWRHFTFHAQIPQHEQRELPACGHCFATFIFQSI